MDLAKHTNRVTDSITNVTERGDRRGSMVGEVECRFRDLHPSYPSTVCGRTWDLVCIPHLGQTVRWFEPREPPRRFPLFYTENVTLQTPET